MESIPLYISQQETCSYLHDQLSSSLFVAPDTPMTPDIYAQLLSRGFRRSGSLIYRPHCSLCRQCISLRLPVKQFSSNRNQKRIQQKNQDLSVRICEPVFIDAHYRLYLRYQQHRHHEGTMASSSADEYMNFLHSHWCDTWFVEFKLQQRLAAVAIVDRVPQALSAVYTFFEPEFSPLSLGNYAVLWQISTAQRLGLDWLYLGYWIKNCRKMAYKDHYRPLYAFINEQWIFFSKHEAITQAT